MSATLHHHADEIETLLNQSGAAPLATPSTEGASNLQGEARIEELLKPDRCGEINWAMKTL